MIKNWRGESIFLWDTVQQTQALTDSSIALVNGLDYKCIKNHTSTNDNKPGTGVDWKSYWYALTSTTGAAWVISTAYNSISQFTLPSNIAWIENVRINLSTSNRVLTALSIQEYMQLTAPLTLGQPTQYLFQRGKDNPMVTLYPYPNNSTDYVIEYMAYKYQEDFDSANDDPDFLQEWLEPLHWNLAKKLAPHHGIDGNRLKLIISEAASTKEIAKNLDHEWGKVQMSPRLQNY